LRTEDDQTTHAYMNQNNTGHVEGTISTAALPDPL